MVSREPRTMASCSPSTFKTLAQPKWEEEDNLLVRRTKERKRKRRSKFKKSLWMLRRARTLLSKRRRKVISNWTISRTKSWTTQLLIKRKLRHYTNKKTKTEMEKIRLCLSLVLKEPSLHIEVIIIEIIASINTPAQRAQESIRLNLAVIIRSLEVHLTSTDRIQNLTRALTQNLNQS